MKKFYLIIGVLVFSLFGIAGFLIQPVGNKIKNEAPLLQVVFLDIGQGDSTLIITPEKRTILIDGGPDNTVIYKLGKYLPFWQRQIDLIILSHPHADHLTGLNEVLHRYDVKKVIMTGVLHTTYEYEEWLKQLQEKNIPVEIARGPKILEIEPNLTLSILYPLQDISQQKFENLNNSSIVAKLTYGQNDFLFMADLEADAQNEIIDQDLAAEIYKVPHQGSSNSQNLEFLQKVNPQYAIISVGENKYGLPSKRVINTLKRISAKVLITMFDGDISFQCNLAACNH